MSKECERRFFALASEVENEVTSRFNIQQQIEDELHTRFEDLSSATRDVTSEIQTDICALEEVVRTEIKARISESSRNQKRMETVIAGLSQAIEYSREESAKQCAQLSLQASSTENKTSIENMNAAVARHVQIMLDEILPGMQLEKVSLLETQLGCINEKIAENQTEW